MENLDFIVRIAELIIAIVGSSIITRIVTVRQRVRQEKADADKKETEVRSDQIENIEKLVEKAYKPIVEDLTTQIKKLQEKVEKLDEDKDKLSLRVEELEEENRMLRTVVREVRPDLVPSRRGTNAKKQRRNQDGTFAKKEERSPAAESVTN